MRPALLLLCALCLPAAALAGDAPLSLRAEGGVYNLFARPVGESPQAAPIALIIRVAAADGASGDATLELVARDDRGGMLWTHRRTMARPDGDGPFEATVAYPAFPGYARIVATLTAGALTTQATTELAVIPPFHPGVRPDSFFASNTSQLRRGAELKLLQTIGMKVQRAHFAGRLARKAPAAPAGALALDFKAQDEAWAESKAAGVWALPIAGYAFEGTKSAQAERVRMHGPPRDADEFCATWEQILRHYPEITTYEFWNEPWIFGWTWADTPEAYRKLQKQWCEMALKVNPKLRLLVGNSAMFCEDHIEPDPACYRGITHGATHHPYAMSTGLASQRQGDVFRSVDYGMAVARRMNLPYYYITEGGSEYPPAGDHAKKDNNANATKIVQYFVQSALTGAFQGNMQWNIGYGPQWTRPNAAFAVLTHFTEDRPVVADVWPHHPLLWGAVFANPRHLTDALRALPRAGELSARWAVAVPPERREDATKVAVVWSLTGASAAQLDAAGTLTIAGTGDLKAYDYMGRPIAPAGDKLTVPFGQYPVYITSDALSVVELREKVATATIADVTPVAISACSLARPADQRQELVVRVENQLNVDAWVTVRLDVPAEPAASVEVRSMIPAGRLKDVPVPWAGVKVGEENQYLINLAAKVAAVDPGGQERPAGEVKRSQVVSAARFAKRTITVDGKLDDWAGATALVLDSAQVKTGADPTQYLLNPNLPKPGDAPEAGRVVARVYTAYDDANVYLAAAVSEPRLANAAGTPWRPALADLPYKKGEPDGLTHVTLCGDVFQFAFGFRERVPGWGRQADDAWAWKGHFYDTDYQYTAHVSATGDRLLRQWGPDTPRRTAYQTANVEGVGPVEGARVKIARDEERKLTVYEIAIPRAELKLFDPGAGRVRFGFVLSNDEKVGTNGLQWSEAAGVFDHWFNSGSFGPSWTQRRACQTWFGIER